MMSVRWIFTLVSYICTRRQQPPARDSVRSCLHGGQERVREHEEEREGDADEGDRIEQCRDNEHPGEQRRRELRLARHAFEEAAAEDAETDCRAERARAENDAAREHGHGLDVCDVFHSTLLT